MPRGPSQLAIHGQGRAERSAGLRHHGRLLLFLVLLNPREAPCPKQMVDGTLKWKIVHTKPLWFCPQTAQRSSSLLGPDLHSDAPSSRADRRAATGSSGGHSLRPVRPPWPRSAPCPPPMEPEPAALLSHRPGSLSGQSDHTREQAAEGLQILPQTGLSLLVIFSISPTLTPKLDLKSN